MERTTIMADEAVVERLRALARDRGVSFAEVVREALEVKAAEYRPRPRSLGLFSSGRDDGSMAAIEPQPPASWR
jgi:hypothetical protein